MERNVIYFPYIRVPEDEWFTRVLLYWDSIGSIVPMEYMDDLSRLGQYMESLVRADLVKPIIPMEHREEIPRFTEAFLEYVDSPGYPVGKGAVDSETTSTFKVHMEKLGPIGDELCERGLARSSTNWAWYDIECYTANQFMLYLASVLGKLPRINSKPITDSSEGLSMFAPLARMDQRHLVEIERMRTLVLKDILPAPDSSIDPFEIASFKDDHKDELNAFRNKVESFIIYMTGIEDEVIRSEAIAEFVHDSRDRVDRLAELMRAKGWRNISLGRFLAYSTAGMGLAAALDGGDLLGVVAAAFGIGSAIYTTIKDGGGCGILESQYAAYAVLARERFPVPSHRGNRLPETRFQLQGGVTEAELAERINQRYAHMLRQPLQGLVVLAAESRRLAYEAIGNKGELLGLLEDIEVSAQHLKILVDIFSKTVRVKDITPFKRPGILIDRDVLHPLHRLMAGHARKRHISLRNVQGCKSIPSLKTDPELLSLVFYNLLDNALKYAFDKSSVGIKCSDVQDKYIVTISNKGPEISDAEAENVFMPGFRGRNVINREVGLGLGLYVARSITNSLGYEINLDSKGSRGARVKFSVSIPKEDLK